MAERIRIDHGNFETVKQQLPNWKVPPTVRLEVRRFLDDLGLGKVNRGRKLPPERLLKYLYALRPPLESFNKDTRRLTLRDIEQFEKALCSGQLCNRASGKPYAHGTMVEIRKLLRIFLRWRLGAARALALTNWLDTHSRPKTPEFLKEGEIERLYKHCRNARQRFLIAVLFDSGARAEEFHNIRLEDVHLPQSRENFVKLTLREEYSKTLGRTIALYWKYSLEAVREYLAERLAEGIRPTDPVFGSDYVSNRKFLQRLGISVLQRPVNYHLFRHSSTTFYATKLNRQELCYRYGWKFSSNMPDTYISRAGMATKELDERFTQTELASLQDDLAKVEQVAKIKDERIRQLEDSMRLLQKDLGAVSKVLRLKPKVEDIESALQRKRQGRGGQMPNT
jgi:integrase